MSDNRRALVTGAGGFIGSQLAEALVRAGWAVRAFIRYTSRSHRGWLEEAPAEILREIEFAAGDVRDADSVRRAIRGCSRVYHLAALIGIPYSYESPAAYVQTNVAGTANVLGAAVELGDAIERVVHTSTSECYGTALRVPIAEDHPLQAQSPYSATKIAADKLAESFHRSFGLRVATVRPFNTFGPRQSLRAIIPTIVAQVLSAPAVRVGNTRPTRDFTFVGDTVRGFMAVGDSAAAEGRVVNLATGTERSVSDVFDAVCRLTGRRPSLEVEQTRVRPADSEVERLVGDASLARTLTGWSAECDFETGLRETIEWMAPRLGDYRSHLYHV